MPGAALPTVASPAQLAQNNFRNGKGCKVLTHCDDQLDRIEKDSDKLCKWAVGNLFCEDV